MTIVFNDRFAYGNNAITDSDIDNLTDTELEAKSSELKLMANMVRRHSVLLKRKTAKEIYNITTSQTDPRISLIIAAATDKEGKRLFPSMQAVKDLMFGPIPNSSLGLTDTQQLVNESSNIFIQGIREISTRLTAAVLIMQLAQIPEQEKHGAGLEKNAIADLERLLQIPDAAVLEEENTRSNIVSFVIRESTITPTVDNPLDVYLYMPVGINGTWKRIAAYTTTINTSTIALAIADAINVETLGRENANLIASVVLNSERGYHTIDIAARRRDIEVATEVISIKIERRNYIGLEGNLVMWGINPTNLTMDTVKGHILAVQRGRVSIVSATNRAVSQQPTILYIRRRELNDNKEVLDESNAVVNESEWTEGSIKFRVSPRSEKTIEIEVPRLTDSDVNKQELLDVNRPNQIALLILDELVKRKEELILLGAVVKNEGIGQTDRPVCAIELIGFSVTDLEEWLILDILEIPKDIEIATGSIFEVLTNYSNRPRSLKIDCTNDYRLRTKRSVGEGDPRIINYKESTLLKKFRHCDNLKQLSISINPIGF